MDLFHTVFALRLMFVLGILNLVSGVAVLLTCRCVGATAIAQKLMKYRWYKRFYAFHCYIWWIFWISVIVHAIFALRAVGNPF